MIEDRWFPGVNERTTYFHEAFAQCLAAGYVPRPSFDCAQERINDFQSPYWNWHQTGCTISTIYRDGKALKVVSNLPNATTTDPKYVQRMLQERKLVNGACPLPDSDVLEMIANDNRVDEKGNTLVSIKPLADWRRAGSGEQSFENALTHPMSAVFGTSQRAIDYFNVLRRKGFGSIYLLFEDDDSGQALVRSSTFGCGYFGVNSAVTYNLDGHLPGVPSSVAQKNKPIYVRIIVSNVIYFPKNSI